MNFKYKDVKMVIANRDFELIRQDETGDIIGVVVVPKGTKGIIESMGKSKLVDSEAYYEIRFIQENTEIKISMEEDMMEIYLDRL